MNFRRISLLFALLFLVTLIVNKIRFHYGWRDAFFRTFLAGFEATRWAPGFSLDAFEKARLQMDQSEISQLLGEPLRKDCDSHVECIWIYSWQMFGTDEFDQRWIVFNRSGKVSELRKCFLLTEF
jgi:hypothetical protein